MNCSNFAEDYFIAVEPIIKKYYPIFKVWVGNFSRVIILNAEDAEVYFLFYT